MSGPLTTWFAGLVMGALFGLAAGLCWVLPKLICALKRNAELEAEVERLKDIIEAMYSCGTRTGVEELYAEYNKEVMGDE